MTRQTHMLFSLLCTMMPVLFISSAKAQGVDPILDQDVFSLTTAGGSFSLTGSVFSNYNVTDPPVFVMGLNYIENPGPGLTDIFNQVILSDNELPFILTTITNPISAGLTSGYTFDTFTLDTSSVADPSTLVGEYDFTLTLVDSNGNEGTGAAFALDIQSAAASPEVVSPWSLGGLLVAGCVALCRRRVRSSSRNCQST